VTGLGYLTALAVALALFGLAVAGLCLIALVERIPGKDD
jgi:hypothetical protein